MAACLHCHARPLAPTCGRCNGTGEEPPKCRACDTTLFGEHPSSACYRAQAHLLAGMYLSLDAAGMYEAARQAEAREAAARCEVPCPSYWY